VTTPDLLAVDELCRLAATARRLGCRAHLVGADADLHALFELAGVADVLLRCPADRRIGPDPTLPDGALR
jgi:hypothetical protein